MFIYDEHSWGNETRVTGESVHIYCQTTSQIKYILQYVFYHNCLIVLTVLQFWYRVTSYTWPCVYGTW